MIKEKNVVDFSKLKLWKCLWGQGECLVSIAFCRVEVNLIDSGKSLVITSTDDICGGKPPQLMSMAEQALHCRAIDIQQVNIFTYLTNQQVNIFTCLTIVLTG